MNDQKEWPTLGYSVKGNRYAIKATRGELHELCDIYSADQIIELVDRRALAARDARIAELEAAAADVLDTELGLMACTGSHAPCEDVLGRLRDVVAGQPQQSEPEWPCSICGNEMRGQGGYLSCECPAQPARQVGGDECDKWVYCPECGSEAVRHEEGDHKKCADCHQEWWADTDYSDVVRKHLGNNYSNWQTTVKNKDAQIADLKRAALAPAAVVVVPEGYAIVPIEPTPEMITAGHDIYTWNARKIYIAMLAAIPQPTPEGSTYE